MPLYEYECEGCGHRFEVIQKFSDAPLQTCPKCSGIIRKLLSSPAIQFKGSGWYITDYARRAKSEPASAGSDKPAEAAGAGEAKGETKAEGKAESKSEKSETKSEAKPSPSPKSTS